MGIELLNTLDEPERVFLGQILDDVFEPEAGVTLDNCTTSDVILAIVMFTQTNSHRRDVGQIARASAIAYKLGIEL